MSTLRADNIGPPGTGRTINLHRGLCKLFVKYDYSGGVPVIDFSYSLTSFTDSAVGIAIANLGVPFQSRPNAQMNAHTWHHFCQITGSAQVYCYMGDGAHALQDGPNGMLTCHGDLAP